MSHGRGPTHALRPSEGAQQESQPRVPFVGEVRTKCEEDASSAHPLTANVQLTAESFCAFAQSLQAPVTRLVGLVCLEATTIIRAPQAEVAPSIADLDGDLGRLGMTERIRQGLARDEAHLVGNVRME